MKNFFGRLLKIPISIVVAVSLAGFAALVLLDLQDSFDGFAVLWAFLIAVYLVLRIGISLRQGTVSVGDWLGALAIPHAIGFVAIMWGPLVYPGRTYAVETLKIEFWVLPTVFLACWALLSVLIVLRSRRLTGMLFTGLRWIGAISVCVMLWLLATAAHVLTQTLPTVYSGLGADLPGSTQTLLAGGRYSYAMSVAALILASSVIFFSGRRNTVSARAFDGLIALLASANIGGVIGLMIAFLPTFPACGSLWKVDPEWTQETAAPTRLQVAALLGHVDSVTRISEKRAWINRQASGNALLFAVIGNNEEIARILLANKADIRVQDRNGETALHAAAQHDRRNIAVLLLEHGAEMNAVSLQGTALDVAVYYKAEGVRKLLLERGAVRAADAQKKAVEERRERRIAEVGKPRKSCTDAMGIRALVDVPSFACAFPAIRGNHRQQLRKV